MHYPFCSVYPCYQCLCFTSVYVSKLIVLYMFFFFQLSEKHVKKTVFFSLFYPDKVFQDIKSFLTFCRYFLVVTLFILRAFVTAVVQTVYLYTPEVS